ncbi:hypothetical protein LY76DRAFT_596021 [Colletotrichum caudatum]|nr:hypothetical protein LY76DRAFT_596021 [Colletotrichum caudatum]
MTIQSESRVWHLGRARLEPTSLPTHSYSVLARRGASWYAPHGPVPAVLKRLCPPAQDGPFHVRVKACSWPW